MSHIVTGMSYIYNNTIIMLMLNSNSTCVAITYQTKFVTSLQLFKGQLKK